jgi:hypothetical protein
VVFTVPANTGQGCFVSLQVRAGGRLSNLGSLAIVSAGQTECTHPTLSTGQLQRLDQGGTITIGSLGVSKLSSRISVPGLGAIDSSTEVASGVFARYTIAEVATANFTLIQSGACYVFQRTGTTEEISQGAPLTLLDAGTQLSLSGPNVTNKAIPKAAGTNSYGETLYQSGFGGFGGTGSPTISEGRYTITGTGGSQVAAFSAALDVPGSFTWTNQNTIPDTIPRSSNLTINWTGGGSGLVTIAGGSLSQTGGTQTAPIYTAGLFSCVAPASAGTFSVPSNILQQIPPAANSAEQGSIGTLTVAAVPDASRGQGQFTAPLVGGGSLDQGFFAYTIGALRTVAWQ